MCCGEFGSSVEEETSGYARRKGEGEENQTRRKGTHRGPKWMADQWVVRDSSPIFNPFHFGRPGNTCFPINTFNEI